MGVGVELGRIRLRALLRPELHGFGPIMPSLSIAFSSSSVALAAAVASSGDR